MNSILKRNFGLLPKFQLGLIESFNCFLDSGSVKIGSNVKMTRENQHNQGPSYGVQFIFLNSQRNRVLHNAISHNEYRIHCEFQIDNPTLVERKRPSHAVRAPILKLLKKIENYINQSCLCVNQTLIVRTTQYCTFQLNLFLQTDNITRRSFFVFIYEEREKQYGLGKHVRELRNKVNEKATVMKGALTKIIVVHFAKKKKKFRSIMTNGFRQQRVNRVDEYGQKTVGKLRG